MQITIDLLEIRADPTVIEVDHMADHQGAEVAHMVGADHQDIGNNFCYNTDTNMKYEDFK